MFSRRKRLWARSPRTGSATVELAICLPLLFSLVWGTIEVNASIFMKQTLTSAAHAGCLAGLRMNASEQQMLDKINHLLQLRNIENVNVAIETESGLPFDESDSGELFTVSLRRNRISRVDFINLTFVEARLSAFKQ